MREERVEEQQFTLLRRILPHGDWSDGHAFRRDLFGVEPEGTSITLRAGAAG